MSFWTIFKLLLVSLLELSRGTVSALLWLQLLLRMPGSKYAWVETNFSSNIIRFNIIGILLSLRIADYHCVPSGSIFRLQFWWMLKLPRRLLSTIRGPINLLQLSAGYVWIFFKMTEKLCSSLFASIIVLLLLTLQDITARAVRHQSLHVLLVNFQIAAVRQAALTVTGVGINQARDKRVVRTVVQSAFTALLARRFI